MNRKQCRRFLTFLSCLCAAAAVWFCYSFWRTEREYESGEADISRIYELVGDRPATVSVKERSSLSGGQQKEKDEGEQAQRLAGCLKLREINEDAVGWIQIEGTAIDYPVMQTPEAPDFYLKHGFDKKYSAYGMIYMDASCPVFEDCHNYLLYGHHMKNGAMFASLENYTEEEYFRAHPVIRFDTLEEAMDFEVAAVFKLPSSMITEEFTHLLAAKTEEAYHEFIFYAKGNSLYDTAVTPRWPQRLLTLTTCEYSQKDGRLLVVAVQAKNE